MRSLLLLPLSAALVVSVGLAPPASQAVQAGAASGHEQVTSGGGFTDPTPSASAQVTERSTALDHGGSGLRLRGRWTWPLAPRPTVVRPFVQPTTAYGAGHRGIDLAASAGQEVLAVEAGTVAHVGRIAGRGTVTILHPSGVRSTYEPVVATVTLGQVVAGGSRLGELEATGSHCRPACLHLGALRDHTYLDPMVFLAGRRPVRLLPLAQAPDG